LEIGGVYILIYLMTAFFLQTEKAKSPWWAAYFLIMLIDFIRVMQ